MSTPTAIPTSIPDLSNVGAIVGGGVGGATGLTCLALAFWYFVIRRQIAKRQISPQVYESFYTGRKDVWEQPKEAPEDDNRRELEANRPRQELEAHRSGSGSYERQNTVDQ